MRPGNTMSPPNFRRARISRPAGRAGLYVRGNEARSRREKQNLPFDGIIQEMPPISRSPSTFSLGRCKKEYRSQAIRRGPARIGLFRICATTRIN